MRSGSSDEPVAAGSMSARLVAGLAGVTQKQLRQWRRSGIVSASALPPRRGAPCAYRWDEYQRARLAALLLQHGLKPRRLRPVLDEYCQVIPPEANLPTTVAGQRAIVKSGAGLGHTAEEIRQGAAFDFVSEAALAKRLKNRVMEEPLGRLQEFSDVVEVRPHVMGGSPTLKGRRLETAALAALHKAGETIAAIAEAYELAVSNVERALAFEQALKQHASTAG